MTGWELFFWLIGFAASGTILLLFLYMAAKMITFGHLKAKKQFNQESEEENGSDEA